MSALPSPSPAIVILDPRQIQPDDVDSEAETDAEADLYPVWEGHSGRTKSLPGGSPSGRDSRTHSQKPPTQPRGSRRTRESVSCSALPAPSSGRCSFAQPAVSVLPTPPLPALPGLPSLYERDSDHRAAAPPGDLFKTEMCRSYEENGWCRYGPKCQFAHGYEELRQPPRHPKYKTEICKTFHSIGTCQYGKRCRFIHNTPPPENVNQLLPCASHPVAIAGPAANSLNALGSIPAGCMALSTTPDDSHGRSLLPPPLLPLPLPVPVPVAMSFPLPYAYPPLAHNAAAVQPQSPRPSFLCDEQSATPAHSPFRHDSATWSYASPFVASDTSSMASDFSDSGVRSRSSSTRSRGDSVRRRLHIFEELGSACESQAQTHTWQTPDSVAKLPPRCPPLDLCIDIDISVEDLEVSSPTFNAAVMASVDAILDDGHDN